VNKLQGYSGIYKEIVIDLIPEVMIQSICDASIGFELNKFERLVKSEQNAKECLR